MNYQSKTFKLYFEGKLIGTVSDITYETPEFSGYLTPDPAFEDIRADMFFMSDDAADEIEGNEEKRFEMITGSLRTKLASVNRSIYLPLMMSWSLSGAGAYQTTFKPSLSV